MKRSDGSISDKVASSLARQSGGDLNYDGERAIHVYLNCGINIHGITLSQRELSLLEEAIADSFGSTVQSMQEDGVITIQASSSDRVAPSIYNETGLSNLFQVYGTELEAFLRRHLAEYFVSKTFFSYKTTDETTASYIKIAIGLDRARDPDFSPRLTADVPVYNKTVTIELPRTSKHRRALLAKKIAKTIAGALVALTVQACGSIEPEKNLQNDYTRPGESNALNTLNGRDIPNLQFDNTLFNILLEFKDDAASRGITEVDTPKFELRVMRFMTKEELPANDSNTVVLGRCSSDYGRNPETGRVQGYSQVLILAGDEGVMGAVMNEGNREANLKKLVYHELGHCLLAMDHGGAKGSIMIAGMIIDDENTGPGWNQMVDEMLSRDNVDALRNARSAKKNKK